MDISHGMDDDSDIQFITAFPKKKKVRRRKDKQTPQKSPRHSQTEPAHSQIPINPIDRRSSCQTHLQASSSKPPCSSGDKASSEPKAKTDSLAAASPVIQGPALVSQQEVNKSIFSSSPQYKKLVQSSEAIPDQSSSLSMQPIQQVSNICPPELAAKSASTPSNPINSILAKQSSDRVSVSCPESNKSSGIQASKANVVRLFHERPLTNGRCPLSPERPSEHTPKASSPPPARNKLLWSIPEYPSDKPLPESPENSKTKQSKHPKPASPSPRKSPAPWTSKMYADLANHLQSTFPFENFARMYSRPVAEVYDVFSAVIQMPLLNHAAEGLSTASSRPVVSLCKERTKAYKVAKKELKLRHDVEARGDMRFRETGELASVATSRKRKEREKAENSRKDPGESSSSTDVAPTAKGK